MSARVVTTKQNIASQWISSSMTEKKRQRDGLADLHIHVLRYPISQDKPMDKQDLLTDVLSDKYGLDLLKKGCADEFSAEPYVGPVSDETLLRKRRNLTFAVDFYFNDKTKRNIRSTSVTENSRTWTDAQASQRKFKFVHTLKQTIMKKDTHNSLATKRL